jgi:PAS domain S-box-containing protein
MLKLGPSKIVLIYALLSALWILSSDNAVDLLFSQNHTLALWASMLKGWLFVLVTSYLLLILLNTYRDQLASREAALRKSEALYKLLVENQSDLIAKLDVRKRFVYVSPSCCRLFGKLESDLLGTSLAPLVLEEDLRPTLRALKHLYAPPYQTYFQHRVQAKTGLRWLAWSGNTILNEQGKITAFLGVGRDITELKKAETALLDSESRFRALFENAPLPYLSLDEQGRLLDVNRRWQETLGYEKEETVGRWFGDLLHPNDKPLFKELFTTFNSSPFLDGAELTLLKKNGDSLLASFSGCVQHGDHGDFLRAHCIFTDVSQRKKAEAAIQASEEKLRVLFETAPDAILIFDADRQSFVNANPAAEALSGLSREELLRSTPQSFYAPVQPDGLPGSDTFNVYGRRALAGEQLLFERALTNAAGKQLICEVRLVALPSPDRRLLRASVIDVTERKKAEAELNHKTSLLASLINSTPDLVFIKDLKGVYLGCNPAFGAFVGKTVEEIVGRTDFDLFDLEVAKFFREQDELMFSVGKPRRNDEWVTFPDGRQMLLDTLKAPLVDQQGAFYGLLGMSRDITERFQLEEELRRSKDEAERANATKSAFLANMSHEIRTPLNGLMGMMQLLKRTRLDSLQQQYADMAIRAGRRLTQLLSDILDLSRIEANRMSIAHTVFVLNDVLDSLRETFDPLTLDKNVSLVVNPEPGLPEKLVGDEVRLRQILFNLVGNALKFSLQGEVRVDISLLTPVSPTCARLLFMISDQGVGIPDDQIGLICNAFTQVEDSYTRKQQGAGLGLAITKRLVELMRGALTFDSEEGKGATVYLSLPMDLPESLPLEKPMPLLAPPKSKKTFAILLVEDDMTSQFSIKYMLEFVGHKVDCAWDGKEALDLVARRPYDLILMDVQLPGMDGIQTMRRIREMEAGKRRTPIIAVTAYAMGGDRERLLDVGMDEHIPKPIEIETCLALIDKVMAASDVLKTAS